MNYRSVIFFGLVASLYVADANAADRMVTINDKAGYVDKSIIQSNIVNECTQLGSQFSESTKTHLEKLGWQVQTTPEIDGAQAGNKLKLSIRTAFSSGNAFIGHHKSVSIKAELFKDGKLVDEYSKTRDSGGGFFGGFKGSCSVLVRCVNTLGADVSKWVNKHNY